MDRLNNPLETISPFAADPFVAQPEGNQAETANCPKKTIEEILQSINGYGILDGETIPKASKSQSITEQKTSPEPVKTQLPNTVMQDNSKNECEAVTLNVQTAAGNPEWTELVEDHQLPEFDVRTFGSIEEISVEVPAPIRSAFECDQDYYDHATIEARLNEASKFQPGPPAVFALKTSSDDLNANQCSTESTNQNGVSESTSYPQSTPDVFWAGPGDEIFIDGKDGYGFIDLACFDISAASFEANQIRIQLDEGKEFQVDYRNVTHAVFAGGVEVELAANEIGFLPKRKST